MARYMCKTKYKEQGVWFEVKCLKDLIALKESRGKDTSFEKDLLKAWKKDPSKFQAKPRPPGYKPKNGMQIISFPKPRVRIRNSTICFPKNMVKRGFPQIPVGKFPFIDNTTISGRLLPFYDRFIIELVYEVEPVSSLNVFSPDSGYVAYPVPTS